MGKMSIDKGKRYERKIAKLLSEWSGLELVRTPDGAPEDLYADIWPKHTTKYFPLAVECKHVEGWSFDQIMSGTGEFYGWLRQAIDQADNARKTLLRWHYPALVFTRNRFDDMLALPITLTEGLEYKDPAVPRMIVNAPGEFVLVLNSWVHVEQPFVIMRLEHFLSSTTYSAVVDACQFYWCVD